MIEKEIESTEAEAERRIYEVGFHIVPSVLQEEVGTIFSALKDEIEKNHGAVIFEDSPKMIPLSYTMQKSKAGKYTKYNQAYFGWVKFESEPEGVLIIDAYLKANEQILRHIVLKTVRENTMSVPKIPVYSRNKSSDNVIPTVDHSEVIEEKVEISETEIDKALETAISE